MTRRNQRLTGAAAESVADVMFALSAPRRLEILSCLDEGPLTVGQIVDVLQMEQSAVSHQLRVLREHDLVKSERDGKRRWYTLSDEGVRELLHVAKRHVEQREKGRSRRTRAMAGY